MSDSKNTKDDANLHEYAVSQLKRAIFSGKYKTGEALPGETELAQQFGVSNSDIKEGLGILQSKGFVEVRKDEKGGHFVREFYKWPFMEDFPELVRYRRVQVDDLATARLFLEPEVCRLTAQKASPKALKEMQDLIDSYAHVKEREKLDPMYAMFHRLVGRACGNVIYIIIMENIMDFTENFIRTVKPVTTVIHNDNDHYEILEAFRQRDSEKAAEIGTRHATDILREMKKLENTYLELVRSNILDPYLEANKGEIIEENY